MIDLLDTKKIREAQKIMQAAETCKKYALEAPPKGEFDRNPYDEKTVLQQAALILLIKAGEVLLNGSRTNKDGAVDPSRAEDRGARGEDKSREE